MLIHIASKFDNCLKIRFVNQIKLESNFTLKGHQKDKWITHHHYLETRQNLGINKILDNQLRAYKIETNKLISSKIEESV